MKRLQLIISYADYLAGRTALKLDGTALTEEEWNAKYGGTIVKDFGEVPDNYEIKGNAGLFKVTEAQ